jgi:hypothetical protein
VETLQNTGARVDLELCKGAAFGRTITYKINDTVTNIAGYSFAAQIRTTTGTLVQAMTCTVTNAAAGLFTISLTGAQTSAMTAGTLYVWSLEQTLSSVVSELLRGYVNVVDEVTQ